MEHRNPAPERLAELEELMKEHRTTMEWSRTRRLFRVVIWNRPDPIPTADLPNLPAVLAWLREQRDG